MSDPVAFEGTRVGGEYLREMPSACRGGGRKSLSGFGPTLRSLLLCLSPLPARCSGSTSTLSVIPRFFSLLSLLSLLGSFQFFLSLPQFTLHRGVP